MRLRFSFIVIFLAHLAPGAEAQAQTPAPACPSVTVESKIHNPAWAGLIGLACPGAPITFTAAVRGIDPKEKQTFHWTVSAGVIVEGQGTSSITVSTEDAVGARVTATAELAGLSGPKSECNRTAQEAVQVAICCLPPCPTITIQCPTEVVKAGQPLTFSANVTGGQPELEITYNWSVSAGVIVRGQGTPTITVDTTDVAGQNVTATLEVGGFPPECDRTESCTPPVAEYSTPGGPGVEGGEARPLRRLLRSPPPGFCGSSGN